MWKNNQNSKIFKIIFKIPSCAVVGLVITVTTLGIVARRFSFFSFDDDAADDFGGVDVGDIDDDVDDDYCGDIGYHDVHHSYDCYYNVSYPLHQHWKSQEDLQSQGNKYNHENHQLVRYSRADPIKIPKEVETQMLDGQ